MYYLANHNSKKTRTLLLLHLLVPQQCCGIWTNSYSCNMPHMHATPVLCMSIAPPHPPPSLRPPKSTSICSQYTTFGRPRKLRTLPAHQQSSACKPPRYHPTDLHGPTGPEMPGTPDCLLHKGRGTILLPWSAHQM